MTYHPISFAMSAIVYPNKVNLIVYQFYKRSPFKNAQVDYKGSSLGHAVFFPDCGAIFKEPLEYIIYTFFCNCKTYVNC